MVTMPDHDQPYLTTGLQTVDEKLGGGIPAGSLIALVVPWDSAGELVAYRQATTDIDTLYATTARPPSVVENDIIATTTSTDTAETSLTVTSIDPQMFTPDSNRVQEIEAFFDEGSQPQLLLDTASDCIRELSANQWRTIVSRLARATRDSGGVTTLLIHGSLETASPEVRSVLQETAHRADGLFQYEHADSVTSGDRLTIRKLRRMSETASDLPITEILSVGRGLTVDREQSFS